MRGQQTLADRVAHVIKNALNGASVTVEALRGRTSRHEQLRGADVAPLAAAASEELGRSLALVEALLAAARPLHAPAAPGPALRPVIELAAAALAEDGGGVTHEGLDALRATDGIDPDAMRGALAAALAGAPPGASVHCNFRDHANGIAIDVRGGAHTITLPDWARASLADAGIRLVEEPPGLTLLLLRAAAE